MLWNVAEGKKRGSCHPIDETDTCRRRKFGGDFSHFLARASVAVQLALMFRRRIGAWLFSLSDVVEKQLSRVNFSMKHC